MSTVAPPSSVVPTVLPAPVPNAVAGRPATTTSAEMNTAMRFGPALAGAFDVLTALPEEERSRSPADAGAIPPADGLGPPDSPGPRRGCRHMATDIVAAAQTRPPSDRAVRDEPGDYASPTRQVAWEKWSNAVRATADDGEHHRAVDLGQRHNGGRRPTPPRDWGTRGKCSAGAAPTRAHPARGWGARP